MSSLAHGFAVVESCCSQSECDDIAERLAMNNSAGTRCLLENDWCQTLALTLKSRLVHQLPEIRGLAAVQCTYFNKSDASNWFVAFHQDRSIPVASTVSAASWSGWSQKQGMTFVHGPDELLNQMVAVRLHIDDSTMDNGPLRVLPGSHDHGTLSPEQIESFRESVRECSLVVRKGGVVMMRPLLLHASSKSLTTDARRVIQFLFGPTVLPGGLEWGHAV